VSTEQANMSRLDLPDKKAFEDQSIPRRSMRQARDGSWVWWGGADTPEPPQVVSPGTATPIMVAVSPMRPGYSIALEYRVNAGPVRETIGQLEPRVRDANARIFRAVVPGQSEGLVEFLPVLRFAGQPISPRLLESAECSW
jgi:hypothetical protein